MHALLRLNQCHQIQPQKNLQFCGHLLDLITLLLDLELRIEIVECSLIRWCKSISVSGKYAVTKFVLQLFY